MKIAGIEKVAVLGGGLIGSSWATNFIYQLGGGEHGIYGLLKHVENSVALWLEDMATFKKLPPGWNETAREGVNREMANRPADQGCSNEEIARWRDDGLIEILKFLKKI